MSTSFNYHQSLGAYGTIPLEVAIQRAIFEPNVDPVLGKIGSDKLQICPQNRSRLTEDVCTAIVEKYPKVEFRLHANVRVQEHPRIVDIADLKIEKDWFLQAARLSKALNAKAYTAHAGKRASASLSQVFEYTKEIEQMFGIPVGVEGHYPTDRGVWLLDSWEEYKEMLESEVKYALDLSHLNILYHQSGRLEESLVKELLSSDMCIEIHVSDNDGISDRHLPIKEEPWWFPLLPFSNESADIFYEGKCPI